MRQAEWNRGFEAVSVPMRRGVFDYKPVKTEYREILNTRYEIGEG